MCFCDRTVEWDSDMSKLSWASWDNFKVCIAGALGREGMADQLASASFFHVEADRVWISPATLHMSCTCWELTDHLL